MKINLHCLQIPRNQEQRMDSKSFLLAENNILIVVNSANKRSSCIKLVFNYYKPKENNEIPMTRSFISIVVYSSIWKIYNTSQMS